jgi:hypothetical protein
MISKKVLNWKEKEPWITFSFPFLLCHHFHIKWSARKSGKDIIEFPSHSCFFECHCFLSACEAFLAQWKAASYGWQCLCSIINVTHWSCICFESWWTPTNLEYTGILCSQGIVNTVCKQDVKEQQTCTASMSLFTSMFCCPIRLHLQNARYQPQRH